MYNTYINLRLDVVHHYLGNGESLRKTAKKFNVNYWNVFEWTKSYKTKGESGILSAYKRPACRTAKELEEKIALLKEEIPTLTVRKAKKFLEKEAIKISIKGIWGIWKRYGYAGLVKANLSNDFTEHLAWSKEAAHKLQQARELYELGHKKESAHILNSITALPKNELLKDFPEPLLNFRRRVEKQLDFFGEMPLTSYLKLVERSYVTCMNKRLYYSALNIGLTYLAALSWSKDTDRRIALTKELKNLIERKQGRDSGALFFARYSLLIAEASVNIDLLDLKKAAGLAQLCSQMLKRKRCPPYGLMTHLGTLYFHLQDFKKSKFWYELAMPHISEEEKRATIVRLAEIFFVQAEYRTALNVLKQGKWYGWVDRTRKLFYQSMQSLMKGEPKESIAYAMKALAISKKDAIHSGLLKAYMAISSAYIALGEKTQARRATRFLLLYAAKSKQAEAWLKILFAKENISITPDNRLPATQLALQLSAGRYQQAFDLARKKAMIAYLHRFIFFVPEVVKRHIEKGKPTGLPKAVLRLPVFNIGTPSFYIKFLGEFNIHKKQTYFKARLSPKEVSFLIQLALRMAAPGKFILVKDFFQNFWPDRQNPAKNLSRMLPRIRDILKIPSYLLEISRALGEACLVNHGLYFFTDYDELEQILATAHAFERADEWEFARREYLHAFSLFRGEPFKKMYDPWSEQMRRVILNKLETEAIHFAKACIEHDNEIRHPPHSIADAKKILEKTIEIIRDCEEIKQLLAEQSKNNIFNSH